MRRRVPSAPRRIQAPRHHLPILLLGLTFAAVPAAIATTLLGPIWRWIETSTGVEAIGHSGPAPWCYVAVWALCAVSFVAGRLWRITRPVEV